MNNGHHSIGPLQQDAAFECAFRTRQPQPASPKGCVILLHGVGSSETSLTTLAYAIAPDVLVVLAQAPLVFSPNQFGWFRVAFTTEGPRIVAEEAESSRQRLIHFVEQVQARFDIAPQSTVIAGFSQGGIMSASVALSAPQLVAGFAILSGRILPELEPRLAPKSQLVRLQAFIGHGEFDSKLPVSWAQKAHHWLDELGMPHQLRLYPIDHTISAPMQADFLAWLDACLSKA
ncbi:alpha/beta hydrolase [Marinobacterium aestuariivivens]|uniref:Alpha/beta hydrolase n=1 Tax=Marinobacterium aestuariivivens TaxID=1698799 RepID=A0ABW2A9M3_9GAMM